jgi:SAM-dependent methyltransferase
MFLLVPDAPIGVDIGSVMEIDRAWGVEDPADTVTFVCNICGRANTAVFRSLERERGLCHACSSNVRWRAIVHVLAMELFGSAIPLPEFPIDRLRCGMGLSDWEGYAGPLASRLAYVNTHYEREPRFDVTRPAPSLAGRLDFLIASDVLEHVAPPVSASFANIRRMLRPEGVLVLTVPYGGFGPIQEHFPALNRYEFLNRDGAVILRNVTVDGEIQDFDDLVFHGGTGSTLEMRRFSESGLLEELEAAGLGNVRIYGADVPANGIRWWGPCSLPMAARPAPVKGA